MNRRYPHPTKSPDSAATLACDHQTDVVLGLVTGNLEATAKIKLRTVNVDVARFAVGAYGSDSADRNDLPRIARERATSLFADHHFHETDIFVIGVCGRVFVIINAR